MKRKDEKFEKNISRLVKLAGDKEGPSKAFTDSLIEDAMGELKSHGRGRKREGRDRTMRFGWKKVLAWAAVLVLVGGIGIAVLVSALSPARKSAAGMESPGLFDLGLKAGKEIKYVDGHKTEEFTAVARGPESQTVVTNGSASTVVDGYDLAYDKGRPAFGLSDREGLHTVDVGARYIRVGKDFLKDIGVDVEFKEGGGYPMAHGGMVPPNGESVDAMFFKNYGVNPFVDTEDDHLSTFATDVDTGSYTVVRGYLHDGHLPPAEAVRVEEFVNYFDYGYEAPQEDDFAVYMEGAKWKFGAERKNSYLLRIGLKARQVSAENRKPAILTFVIDVSGSMDRENRLGLVKRSLRMLVEQLREGDTVGIAVYGSRGRKVMGYKRMDEKDDVLYAIDSLQSGGSTFAEEGIRIGYEMAEEAYRTGHINRVILCSDGVANVGQTGADDILEVIKKKADKGITLSAIGFGMGNYNDVLMERLGDKGNGYYAYVDTIAEAKRLFEDNLTGTLEVVARDVKVQVDFNPKVVRSYRLMGYENRDVPDEKFRDDKYDGGEMGAGHSVTAMYELKLWPEKSGPAATTYVRYKDAETREVTEFKSSIASGDMAEEFGDASTEFKLAATAAEFAEILRQSYWAKGAELGEVLEQAREVSAGFESDADVIELVDLIAKANRLREVQEEAQADANEQFMEAVTGESVPEGYVNKVYDVAELVRVGDGGIDAETRQRDLCELFVETVEPESWVDNGGKGVLRFYGDTTLVVRQTPEIQGQIAALLENMRKSLKK